MDKKNRNSSWLEGGLNPWLLEDMLHVPPSIFVVFHNNMPRTNTIIQRCVKIELSTAQALLCGLKEITYYSYPVSTDANPLQRKKITQQVWWRAKVYRTKTGWKAFFIMTYQNISDTELVQACTFLQTTMNSKNQPVCKSVWQHTETESNLSLVLLWRPLQQRWLSPHFLTLLNLWQPANTKTHANKRWDSKWCHPLKYPSPLFLLHCNSSAWNWQSDQSICVSWQT